MAFQDIRKSRKFLSATDVGFVLGALILLAALLALNLYLARTLNGGEWLFLRWSGARAFLFEKLEPYSLAIAQRVQFLTYGREAYLGEYPYALNDPFYIVLLYTPLALFSNFVIAHAVWMLFSQAALVGIVLLSIKLTEWEPPRWFFIVLVGLGLFSSFSVNAFLSASPTIFVTLIYLSILVALRSFADEFAGALLLLVAYQWEVGALFFLFILVFIIANRRWSVFVGFGMTLAVLFIVSFIVKSDWLAVYARSVLFDWTRGVDYSFGVTLAYIFPTVSLSVGRWLAVAAVVVLLFEAIRSVNEHFIHVIWVAFLALALNPLLGLNIFPSDHVVLLPAFILVIALVWQRWTNRRAVVIFLFILLLVAFYDIYFQSIFSELHLYSDLLKILPPIATITALYWMRWWAVRPPRIWADQFGVHK